MTIEKKRYAINFDLEQKKIEKYLDERNPEKAYGLIRKFLKDKGFIHVQGSGYNSEKEMLEHEVFQLMLELDEAFEWFGKSVKSIQATEIGEQYDYTEQFKKFVTGREVVRDEELYAMKQCMKRTAARTPERKVDKELER